MGLRTLPEQVVFIMQSVLYLYFEHVEVTSVQKAEKAASAVHGTFVECSTTPARLKPQTQLKT